MSTDAPKVYNMQNVVASGHHGNLLFLKYTGFIGGNIWMPVTLWWNGWLIATALSTPYARVGHCLRCHHLQVGDSTSSARTNYASVMIRTSSQHCQITQTISRGSRASRASGLWWTVEAWQSY